MGRAVYLFGICGCGKGVDCTLCMLDKAIDNHFLYLSPFGWKNPRAWIVYRTKPPTT